ncbi:MAG TPA: carboxypeptidase-like regulatory domain-containing protein, partial [Polyangiaceae bacterium]|nr:carboxypeptidase-like regulatory domain-containing protein [Polyangiaceae bacterium]
DECVSAHAGAFSLARVDAGVTELLVSASGHVARVVPLRAPDASEPSHQEVTIRLEPGGVDISGRVADMSGGPVANALVLMRSDAEGRSVSLAFSNEDGRFASTTAAGVVHVEVRADSYAPGVRDVSAPVEGLLIGLVPSSTLIGTVIDAATGRGLEDVEVRATNRDGLRGGPFEAVTTADGGFAIEAVPTGGYELVARARGWRSEPRWSHAGLASSSEPIVLEAQPATSLTASVRVADAPCEAGWVQLQPLQGAAPLVEVFGAGATRVEGVPFGAAWVTVGCERPAAQALTERIELTAEAATRAWTLEPTPAPPETSCAELSVTVRALVVSDARLGFLPTVRLSDVRGAVFDGQRERQSFSFEDVCPGEYDVYLAEAPVARRSIIVTRADRGRTIEVRLEVPRHEELAGQVVDEQGLPVPDAWVRAAPQTTSTGASNVPVLSDAEGRFVIPEVFAGIYGVSAESAGGRAELNGVQAGDTGLLLRLHPHGSEGPEGVVAD